MTRSGIGSNGSPDPTFETDEQNQYFLATINIHPLFRQNDTAVGVENVVENSTSLSQKLSVTHRTIQRDLAELQRLNYIRRVGPDKGGHWEIINGFRKEKK